MRLQFALILLLASAVAGHAQTMAAALDACESFVVTGEIPETVDTDLTLTGDFDYATVPTEVGPVLLTFAKDYGMDAITYCDVTGADPRDDGTPIQVPWAKALPPIDDWLATRAARGGGKLLPVFGAQRMFAACSDTAEYFISAQPYPIGDKTATLSENDWPLVVRINEWTGTAARPCDL